MLGRTRWACLAAAEEGAGLALALDSDLLCLDVGVAVHLLDLALHEEPAKLLLKLRVLLLFPGLY